MSSNAPYPVLVRLEDFAQFSALMEAVADLIAASEGEYPLECLAVRDAIGAYQKGLS